MSAPTFEQASLLSGRQLMLVVVIGLHAFAISALLAMRIAADAPKPPFVFKPPTSIAPIDIPPPPEKPAVDTSDATGRTIYIPSMRPLDFTPPADVPSTSNSDTGIASGQGQPDVGTVVPEPAFIPPTELQYRATRSPDEFYPAIAQRLSEQGMAVVRVCVSPSGRREGTPTIDRSSGSRNLDAAAVRWASEALAFTPATRNGSPVTACKGFRVNFTLR